MTHAPQPRFAPIPNDQQAEFGEWADKAVIASYVHNHRILWAVTEPLLHFVTRAEPSRLEKINAIADSVVINSANAIAIEELKKRAALFHPAPDGSQ